MALKSQEFFTSGTFTVPTGVSHLHVTMIGGGGGSGNAFGGSSSGSGAGGSGEFCQKFPLHVTPGAAIPIVIGSGGSAGLALNQNGGPGSSTTLGSFLTCQGGQGGANCYNTGGVNTGSGAGAGGNGGGIGANLTHGVGTGNGGHEGPALTAGVGKSETPTHFGGSGGGGGGVTEDGGPSAGQPGLAGAAGGHWLSVRGGGGGGSDSPWSIGVAGSDNNIAGQTPPSTAYGCGAGGSGAFKAGAVGQKGYCLVQWMG